MKKKITQLITLLCIILIVFIVNVTIKIYKVHTDKETTPKEAKVESLINNTEKKVPAEVETINQSTDTLTPTPPSSTESLTPNEDISLDTIDQSNTPLADSSKTNTVSLTKEKLAELPAASIVEIDALKELTLENCFYHEEINDDVKNRILGKSYKEDCTVPFDELKYVRILYYGFDDKIHIGELIVNTAIADDITDIFAELYQEKYPIEQVVLVDEYNGDDNISMAANNTSAFNYRSIPGSTNLSKHALGLAIDINPLYNPYVQYTKSETIILPKEGTPYADRSLDCPYYITEGDVCYNAFTKRDFTWGGFWKSVPDYQHFQKTID